MAQSGITRLMMTGGLALVTTVALFLVMKVLVTGQDFEAEEALASIAIDFVRVERDEDVNEKSRSLKRPSKQEPDEPPPPPKLDQVTRPNMDKASTSANFDDFGLAGMNLNAPVDGDALAIVRVLPQYPRRALSRNIEGWVLLEFTISELGVAVNPVVVDSEPSGIFDRAAINAVQKWKYRPMMDGGRAVPRPGVRQLISFQIAK
jgi:protein TonB